jgi:ATP-binding cassette subfamily B protein
MEVFEHIENMSLNQFNEMPVGSLVTRVANYTTSMSDLFTNVLVNLLKNIFTVIAAFFILLFKSPFLTLILCSFIVAVFLISFIFRKIITKFFRKERAILSDLNAFLNENLSGMKITQIFNQEKRKEREFLVKNEDYRKTRYKIILAFAIYRPFITFLYYGAIATTFIFGIFFALTPGEVVAFYLLLGNFFQPIQNIADQLNHIQRATTASERLFNLMDVQPEVVDDPDAIDIEKFEGKIEFKNVWFAYEDEHWILRDVSFEIQPKQTVAFVGATGAGKTTILSLIVRNYEIQKGQILIDGIDIKKIKVKSLRKAIGQMLQDVFLFTGTVKSNITLHDDSFSDEEIIETCKYVNADSFIEPTSNGLNAEVAERGENFSQGQRQLLSFARTVLHKPQILILDEATANIDTETEVLIQESLDRIKNIGTMLVVAHRLSTIQKADQIIVLQKGEVIEKGNHQSLLKQKGHYYKLYQLQFENKD